VVLTLHQGFAANVTSEINVLRVRAMSLRVLITLQESNLPADSSHSVTLSVVHDISSGIGYRRLTMMRRTCGKKKGVLTLPTAQSSTTPQVKPHTAPSTRA
jgi:hypothetical protein